MKKGQKLLKRGHRLRRRRPLLLEAVHLTAEVAVAAVGVGAVPSSVTNDSVVFEPLRCIKKYLVSFVS